MSTEVKPRQTVGPAVTAPAPPPAVRRKSPYPYWFCLPAAVIFFVFFVVPTFSSFFFSLTRWDLTTWEFIGLDN
jgi:raffinose/stachyose/melibiose transport system permease protein